LIRLGPQYQPWSRKDFHAGMVQLPLLALSNQICTLRDHGWYWGPSLINY
jgi:hypothetical protein